MLDCTIPAVTVAGVVVLDVDEFGRIGAKSCQVTLRHSEVRRRWSAVS